jgi:uncharacterized membrane protein
VETTRAPYTRAVAADRADGSKRRYVEDSAEFSRVANLSDAVFAIAMTLLVLTLDVPAMDEGGLARALADRVPQLGIVVLAFGLAASIWWAHHKFFAMLGFVEPGLIALNLVLLGLVALIPFPTRVLGTAPLEPAAVVPFLGLFVATLVVFLLLFARAHAVGAWHRPMPAGLYPWLMLGLGANVAMMSLAALVALWAPVAGLIVAALTGTTVAILVSMAAPPAYRDWSL